MADSEVITLDRPTRQDENLADTPTSPAEPAHGDEIIDNVIELKASSVTQFPDPVVAEATPVEPVAADPVMSELAPVEPVAAADAPAPIEAEPASQSREAEPVDLTAVKQAMMELASAPVQAPRQDDLPRPVAEAPSASIADFAPALAAAAAMGGTAVAAASSDSKEPAPPAEATAEQGLPPGRIGVLLVNLGTPDAAEAKAVRAYLREFLSDRRVIENDGFLWKLVLNWIVLPFRPRIKAKAYRKIWNTERNESPIKTITRAQAEKLGETIAGIDDGVVVDWAMRYGNPSIDSRLDAMLERGCERILLMPLYPQYSASTTATVNDVVFRKLLGLRKQPALRVLPPYYNDTVYIEALASSIETHLAAVDIVPDVIVASFHGMPRDYIEKGDPYAEHCAETVRLLRNRLGLDEDKLLLTFQSRFGRGKWLEPPTDKTLKKLAKSGVKKVAVVTPGFAADCLETLEEIAIENAHIFKKAGGEQFTVVPCLNASEPGMTVLWQTALRELKGWI